ncbi:MAG: Coenzyme F420 hydrogenase/dehydrogenase, beta subunit C-terminal domain [Opitutaceae bacterium]
MKAKTVRQIADWRLCLGCGACSYICPDDKISLFDCASEGIRPLVADEYCLACRDCLTVCPAHGIDHKEPLPRSGLIAEVREAFGPVLEIWEGHATDPEIRFTGSSGGILTALSLFCLEAEGFHGVLHIGQDPARPLRNHTVLSRTRRDLLNRTGSRYAPASACESLQLIEDAPAPCVFIGQPSEATASRKAAELRPRLKGNLALVLSFFCAGSPSTQGTIDLLRSAGIDPDSVESFRYRGNGWPGMFTVKLKDEPKARPLMSYAESWGFVQAYRPFSTHLCPDGTGEDADISCGDPWYRPVEAGEAGSSLVLVRTERGREILQKAIQAGYVVLKPAEPWKLLASQKGLVAKRGAVWGRLATMRAIGLPVPKLRGFSLFKNWMKLTLSEKLRSTVGTLRRVITRGYYRPQELRRD